MYYPNVITFLIKNVGPDEAKQRIFRIGQEVGREMLKIWDPKTTDIKKMILKWYKLMWNSTKYVKVKKIKEKDREIYRIIDKKCGVCDPETTIEGLEMPCVSIDGYLDACLEYISARTPLSSYKVQTIRSIAMGDPYCEHEIEIKR